MVGADVDVRKELIAYGLPVGTALYEKCLAGSGVYALGATMVVKAELASDPRQVSRLMTEGTYMRQMETYAIGPKVYRTGVIQVQHSSRALIVYSILERYTCDLGILSDLESQMPSTVIDSTVGWLLNSLFRRVAYRTRLLLTDLKPSNIVANLDMILLSTLTPRVRISDVILIDFGPEYCIALPEDVHSRTAHVTMLLLYSAISTALGFQRCADVIAPYIARLSVDVLGAAVAWMDHQPVVQTAIRQYTTSPNASTLFAFLLQPRVQGSETQMYIYP